MLWLTRKSIYLIAATFVATSCHNLDSGQSREIGQTAVAIESIIDALASNYVETGKFPENEAEFKETLLEGSAAYFRSPAALNDGWGKPLLYAYKDNAIYVSSTVASSNGSKDIECRLTVELSASRFLEYCRGLRGRQTPTIEIKSFEEYKPTK